MPIDIQKRVSRYKQFYASREAGKLLVISDYNAYSSADDERAHNYRPRLDEYDFCQGHEHERFLSDTAIFMGRVLARRGALDDDYIPQCWPNYGIAQFSAIVSDSPVAFTGNTSWIDPCIDEWQDMERLSLDENNYWFRKQQEAFAYLAKAGAIGFSCPRIVWDHWIWPMPYGATSFSPTFTTIRTKCTSSWVCVSAASSGMRRRRNRS